MAAALGLGTADPALALGMAALAALPVVRMGQVGRAFPAADRMAPVAHLVGLVVAVGLMVQGPDPVDSVVAVAPRRGRMVAAPAGLAATAAMAVAVPDS